MSVLSLFGPVDYLAEDVVAGVAIVEFLLLALAVVNVGARAVAHRRYVSAARDGEGDEVLSRSRFLEATNVLLVLGACYYVTVELNAGLVFATLAVGLVLTDFFEFEARLVEARNGYAIERPKAAIAASAFMLLYIAYKSLFFLVDPLWDSIV